VQCWQLLVCAHAVLDAWDARAYLLFMDADEFFVLPTRGASLAGALQRCAGNRLLARPARRARPAVAGGGRRWESASCLTLMIGPHRGRVPGPARPAVACQKLAEPIRGLQLNPVAFYQLAKIAIPPAIIAIEAAFYSKRLTRYELAAVAMLCVGRHAGHGHG